MTSPDTTTTDQPTSTHVVGLSVPDAQWSGTTVITKRFGFEAAHFLPNVTDDHKCRRVHGHSYVVRVHVAGPMDEYAGWVVDFGEVKQVWKPLEAQLDHHLLNDLPGLENPTAENLAAWIWERYERERRAGRVPFSVSAVEVAETADSSAMFVAPRQAPWVPGHRHVALPDVAPTNGDQPGIAPAPASLGGTAGTAHAAKLESIEDVQSRPDTRGVAIEEVGVSKVRLPIEVLDRDRGRQATVASITMGVDLAAEVKGTHLSRFLQAVRDHQDALTLLSLGELTGDLRQRLGADRARVRVEFPYFIEKRAPVTGEVGTLDVDCAFEVIDTDGELEHWMEVTTPITTVCPCSRDISDYGAHNQRGFVTIRARFTQDEAGFPTLVWIEELVEVSEAAGSSPVYSVIKRPDERHVTMAGYDNPKFVEDVIRDVAVALRADDRIAAFDLTVENDESIHAHNAYARTVGAQRSREFGAASPSR